MKIKNKELLLISVSGLFIGFAAILLTKLGNPSNMGFCIACFLRDIAGSIKLHTAAPVQYFRPEIVGLVLGSFTISVCTREFRAKAGSSPFMRFLLGAMVMIGALVFLGCPLRMVIRMGSGDLNAFVGFFGFSVGIIIGVLFLKKGFSLGRAYDVPPAEGVSFPVLSVVLFVLFLIFPTIFAFSETGPGSMHAPILLAFIIALIGGAAAQKSRLCMVGGMRNALLFSDFQLMIGFCLIFLAVLLGNIVLGNFHGFSTQSQPISHSAEIWNFLGMMIVGWGSTLLGGCPLRQLILAGEGNADSAVTVIGMVVGAAVSHNFGLAGSADSVKDGVYTVGGIGINGKIAVVLILVCLLAISSIFTFRKEEVHK